MGRALGFQLSVSSQRSQYKLSLLRLRTGKSRASGTMHLQKPSTTVLDICLKIMFSLRGPLRFMTKFSGQLGRLGLGIVVFDVFVAVWGAGGIPQD